MKCCSTIWPKHEWILVELDEQKTKESALGNDYARCYTGFLDLYVDGGVD